MIQLDRVWSFNASEIKWWVLSEAFETWQLPKEAIKCWVNVLLRVLKWNQTSGLINLVSSHLKFRSFPAFIIFKVHRRCFDLTLQIVRFVSPKDVIYIKT